MKQKKMAPFLAFTLSLELVIAPVAYSQSNTKNTSENFASAIDAAGKVWSMVNSNMRPPQKPQTTFDMQNLRQQQTPTPDKYFNPQKLALIPGLGEYLAMNNINPQMLDCKTLPTTLFEAKNEVCRIGVTGDRGEDPRGQLHEMFTYHNEYFQIEKMYRNFTASSNSAGQLFGVGCMENAMKILNGFFKYRIDELDKLTTNIEALQDQFRKASKADLEAVEEAVAVLEGGNSELTNKVKTKRPDLFDFGKRLDNAACTSMFSKDNFNKMGRDRGLNNIGQTLKDTMGDPRGGKFSGESYAQSHTSVVKDLNNLADKAAKQFELGFSDLANDPNKYGALIRDMKNRLSSPNGLNNVLSPDVFSESQTKFLDRSAKLSDERSNLISELTAGGANVNGANRLLGNLNSSNFENELTAINNQIQNRCLANNLSDSSSVDSVLKRVYRPDVSGHANQNAANFLKDKIKDILNNSQTRFDRKIAELKALEAQQKQNYVVKMDGPREVQFYDNASGTVQTRMRDAAVMQTPSSFFIDTIENCKAQFQVNKLGTQMSGANAIQRLRTLNQDYKTLAKTHAGEMKQEMKKRLIECSSPEIANNTTIGSCTPARFNTQSPGFCANAALSCSKNMQACNEQADKYTKEIKEQKTARVNNYNGLVNKNKQDIIKIFDSALARYMKDGEMLRGIFGAGFSSPSGIVREVPEGNRYLKDFQQATASSPDGRLLLENPDEYVKMFKNNIALLKDSVKKQQDQILGGEQVGNNSGLLAQHIEQTKRNYNEVARGAKQYAQSCISKHDQYVQAQDQMRAKHEAEEMERQSQLGEKTREFCRKYSQALDQNPGPACRGNMDDVFSAVSAIDGGFAANRLERLCDSYNSGSEGASSSIITNALRTCERSSASPTGPAPAPASETSAATNQPSQWCAELLDCQYPKIEGQGENRIRIECSHERKESLSLNIMEANGDGGITLDGELPYFCMAGNNSDRSVGRGTLDNIIQGLQKGLNQARRE